MPIIKKLSNPCHFGALTYQKNNSTTRVKNMMCILNRAICVKWAPLYVYDAFCHCCWNCSIIVMRITEARFWSIKPIHSLQHSDKILRINMIGIHVPCDERCCYFVNRICLSAFQRIPHFSIPSAPVEASNFQSHFSSVCYILLLYGTLSIEYFCSIIFFFFLCVHRLETI